VAYGTFEHFIIPAKAFALACKMTKSITKTKALAKCKHDSSVLLNHLRFICQR